MGDEVINRSAVELAASIRAGELSSVEVVTAHLDRIEINPGRLAEVEARLAEECERQAHHGVSYWPMFDRETGSFVGCCGLRPYRDDPTVREMGFQLRRSAWGKGYATEAARHVIAFAFDVLGLTALFAGHNPQNVASRHLLEKLGFAFTHEEFYEPTGLQHPSYLLTRT